VKPSAAAALAIAAIAVASLAAPAGATAGLASITFRAVPLHGERTLQGSPGRFDLVGLRWHGSGSVGFSVRSLGGRWGPWLDAAAEEDGPNAGSPEARASRGWRVGSPTWVGPSNGIRYRITGTVRDVRASFVRSPELRIPLRAVASAGAPAIVPRSAWDADESIVRHAPLYAPAIRFAIVHHTAGTNAYSPAQAAAILRGIEVYHVKSNGWNDIGYNFLVDRFGTVYEGRAGGVDKNVIGAHALGFNTGSVGVAVMGTFTTSAVPAPVETSLAKLLAWKLDAAHVDPLSTLTFASGGSERYVAGTSVTLRAVSAHRDTGLTTCPGDQLYARIPAIAAQAQKLGLPKIYEPRVTEGLGEKVRFQARVSGALPWTVTVSDSGGLQLGAGTGQGPTVDWTWDSTSSSGLTGVRWRIEVAGATPASGTIGKAVVVTPPPGPLAVTDLKADPATISPNGDGAADTATISYTMNATATVTATLLDASGVQLADLAPPIRLAAGVHSFAFDGLGQPDGRYTVVIGAVGTDGASVTQPLEIGISRVLGPASLAPSVFTPNGDGAGDELTVSFQLGAPASVRVRVLREGAWVATPFAGPLEAGAGTVEWDGSKRVGNARDGTYTAVLEVTDAVGTSQVTLPFTLDRHAPTIKLLARPLRLAVSEASTVTVRVNGAARRATLSQAGTIPLTGIRKLRTLTAVARDAAGNKSTLRRP